MSAMRPMPWNGTWARRAANGHTSGYYGATKRQPWTVKAERRAANRRARAARRRNR